MKVFKIGWRKFIIYMEVPDKKTKDEIIKSIHKAFPKYEFLFIGVIRS